MARRVVFIIFALIFSGVTVVVIRMWMSGASNPLARHPAGASAGVPVTRVLVANADLPAGSVLRGDQLRWQNWPIESAGPYVVESQARESSFVGGVVRSRLTAGEPIIAANVTHPGDRGFMAAVLNAGDSAVTINVTPSTGMAGFIFPGDRVDLLLTMTQPSSGAGPSRRFSETLLTNLRVVGMDQTLSDEKSGKKDAVVPKTATLEVTPKQAEVVALGSELGILSLSLRSLSRGVDGVTPPTSGRTWESEVTHVLPPLPSSGPEVSMRPAHAEAPRGVRVFRGGELAEAASRIPLPGASHP